MDAQATQMLMTRGLVSRPSTVPLGCSTWPMLMELARPGAHEPTLLALAGVLSMAWERHGPHWLPLPGLGASATRALLGAWFPGAARAIGLDWAALAGAERAEPRADEIEEIVGLLGDPASLGPGVQRVDALGVAHAIGLATLGDDHLWQDLGLRSRADLRELLVHWFAPLAARNTGDMKWKKFLYKQLCERAEIHACRAPSCGVCSDYAHCFGPE